jgi:hypothetical protein
MISSADFKVSLFGSTALQHRQRIRRGASTAASGEATTSCRADPVTVSGQFSCPPAGSFVAVSGQFLVAADT